MSIFYCIKWAKRHKKAVVTLLGITATRVNGEVQSNLDYTDGAVPSDDTILPSPPPPHQLYPFMHSYTTWSCTKILPYNSDSGNTWSTELWEKSPRVTFCFERVSRKAQGNLSHNLYFYYYNYTVPLNESKSTLEVPTSSCSPPSSPMNSNMRGFAMMGTKPNRCARISSWMIDEFMNM